MLAKINTNYAIIGWKGGIKRQKVQTCETGVTNPLLVYLTRCDTSYKPYFQVRFNGKKLVTKVIFSFFQIKKYMHGKIEITKVNMHYSLSFFLWGLRHSVRVRINCSYSLDEIFLVRIKMKQLMHT